MSASKALSSLHAAARERHGDLASGNRDTTPSHCRKRRSAVAGDHSRGRAHGGRGCELDAAKLTHDRHAGPAHDGISQGKLQADFHKPLRGGSFSTTDAANYTISIRFRTM